MKRLLLICVLGLTAAIAAAQNSGSGHMDASGEESLSTLDPRVLAAASALACDCGTCPHEPVDRCRCGTAASYRSEIATLVQEGKNADEIVAAMIAKHGPQLLAAPPTEGLGLLYWLMPLLAAAVAGIFMVVFLRRFLVQGRSHALGATPPGSAPIVDGAYLARVDEELEND